MAIPKKPLVISGEDGKPLDLDEMTLGDIALLYPDDGTYSIPQFRKWMIAHANWTRQEIDAIKRKELDHVYAQVSEKVREISVPLANEPS